MILTTFDIALQLVDYANGVINAHQLACWAEDAMLQQNYKETDFEVIADLLPQIGLVNVEGFEFDNLQAKEWIEKLIAVK